MKLAVGIALCVLGLGTMTGCGKKDAAPQEPQKELTADEAAKAGADEAKVTPPAKDEAKADEAKAGEAKEEAPKRFADMNETEKAKAVEDAKVIAAAQEKGDNAAVAACKKAAACCEAAVSTDAEKTKCKQLEELAGLAAMLKDDAQAKMKGQCEMLVGKITESVTPIPDACK